MRSALSSCLCAMLGHRVCSQDTAGGISKARHISRLGPSLNAIRYNKHSTVVACLGWGKRAETGRAAMQEDTASRHTFLYPPSLPVRPPKQARYWRSSLVHFLSVPLPSMSPVKKTLAVIRRATCWKTIASTQSMSAPLLYKS